MGRKNNGTGTRYKVKGVRHKGQRTRCEIQEINVKVDLYAVTTNHKL